MSVVTKSEHCKKDRSLGDLRGGSSRRNWDFGAPSVRLEAESIPHLLAATFGADAVLLPKFRYSRFPDPLTCLSSAALLAFNELFGRSPNEDRVFVNIHGERLKGHKHWFDDAVAEAGVGEFASKLIMAGVDLRTVAELMGHKGIQTTMRYAHLGPAHKLAAVERLGGCAN